MKSVKLFSLLFLFFVSLTEAKSQDVSNTFVLPSYSVDVAFLIYEDENNDDIFIGGFHQLGFEVGKKFGKRKISLNVKYGINPLHKKNLTDFIASYKTYWGLAFNYRAQIFPRDLSSNRFLKFGYRGTFVYHQYNGSRGFRNAQGNVERVDASEDIFGVESGFYFDLGKKNKNKILVNVEPIYFRITNNLFGIGALRTGIEFQF